MSRIYDDSNRQIMPRWYPFITACAMGDIHPENEIQKPKIETPISFENKKSDWQQNQTVPTAIDLVGTALILGRLADVDAIQAATFLRNNSKIVSSLGIQLANLFLSEREDSSLDILGTKRKDQEIYVEIARLKQLVHQYPRNAIIWCDLAFLYSLLGQKLQAENHINIAISLAGENRFVLRSAARCFLFLEQPERALFHLRRSKLIKIDPWVLSTEISISEGIERKSNFVKTARKLVRDSNFSPWSLNELTGTLGTLEARHGEIRKSKKLMRQALLDPNENTFAQSVWLARKLGQELMRPNEDILAAYEANARFHLHEYEFRQSLEASKKWSEFQPFSSKPVIFASYVASVCLQDDLEAIRIIETASNASSNSFLVKNNYAFALASQNRLVEAERVVAQINEANLDQEESYILSATRGLIQFRSGNIEDARRLYQDAISAFKKKNDFRSATIATFFWAREESIIQSILYEKVFRDATNMIRKHDVRELLHLAK